MNKTPYISVIVTAYNRKDFILKAIRSVLTQSLDKSEYEIIVIKNFNNKALDTLLKGKNVKTILFNVGKNKFTMLPAIKQSSGEVLVFLDDDDEWEKTKLDKIYRLFTNNKKLGYYHNNYSFIDNYGKSVNSNIRLSQRETIEKLKTYNVEHNEKNRRVWNIIDYGLFFNNSCVAMRRDIITFNGLGGMPFGVDLQLLYASLLSKYNLFFDSDKLTRYRIHTDNTSMHYNKISKKIELIKQSIISDKKILNIVKISGNKDFETSLIYSILWKKTVLDIMSMKNINLTKVDLLKLIKLNFRIYPFTRKRLVMLGLLYLLFPKTTNNLLNKKF